MAVLPRFTLHFATINTEIISFRLSILVKFTLHFATINTVFQQENGMLTNRFTLHFATINTKKYYLEVELQSLNLHYTLLLLILLQEEWTQEIC